MSKLVHKVKSTLNLAGRPRWRLAVCQYERDSKRVGYEAELHWAFIIVNANDNPVKLEAWACHAVDRNYNSGPKAGNIEWIITPSAKVELTKTTKFLGGVYICDIVEKNLDACKAIISQHLAVPKFKSWNCRDWVLECITVLQAGQHITLPIRDQRSLLPALRKASIAADRELKARTFKAVLVEFE